MDDRCHHCSGYGTVPSPYTGDAHRITCPKCDSDEPPHPSPPTTLGASDV